MSICARIGRAAFAAVALCLLFTQPAQAIMAGDVHASLPDRPELRTDPNLAVVVLSTDLPPGVPYYSLLSKPLDIGTIITLVGYGASLSTCAKVV